jgi:hypothetical protein
VLCFLAKARALGSSLRLTAAPRQTGEPVE